MILAWALALAGAPVAELEVGAAYGSRSAQVRGPIGTRFAPSVDGLAVPVALTVRPAPRWSLRATWWRTLPVQLEPGVDAFAEALSVQAGFEVPTLPFQLEALVSMGWSATRIVGARALEPQISAVTAGLRARVFEDRGWSLRAEAAAGPNVTVIDLVGGGGFTARGSAELVRSFGGGVELLGRASLEVQRAGEEIRADLTTTVVGLVVRLR